MRQAKEEKQPRHPCVPRLPGEAGLEEINNRGCLWDEKKNPIDWDFFPAIVGGFARREVSAHLGLLEEFGLETYLSPGRQRCGPRARAPWPRAVRRRLSSNPDGARMRSGLYTSALFLQHYFTARKKEGGGRGKKKKKQVTQGLSLISRIKTSHLMEEWGIKSRNKWRILIPLLPESS